jgi:hypothetical protein
VQSCRGCRELYKLVPAKDPTRTKVYGSCALVGNSGVMLVAKQGAAIDAHDMVFRFNGAPTRGLEEYVGSRTDFRLVNSKWTESRETASETVLWNMRAASALEFFTERKKKNPKERFSIFTADFVNYVGQTAAQLSASFKGTPQAAAFEAMEGPQSGYTPTSGFTGLLMAINVCAKVTMYGMQLSEAQGFSYHYHNQCPQPYSARDDAEFLLFNRIVQLGLASFHEPCIVECKGEQAQCDACRAAHPELFAPELMARADAVLKTTPLPVRSPNAIPLQAFRRAFALGC